MTGSTPTSDLHGFVIWLVDMITIGAQCGGPRDGNIADFKVDLFHLFEQQCNKTYCDSIDEFGLVLRINGSLDSFGSESIKRVRRSNKERYITADIVIPMERWQTLKTAKLKRYFVQQVRSAIQICATRLEKDRELVDTKQLLTDVDVAIAKFLKMKHPPNPDIKKANV